MIKYELKNGKILKDGHTMFLEDVVMELNQKAKLDYNKRSIEDRKELFKDKLEHLIGTKYDYQTLQDFFDYWTEHGEKDRKMRFEKQTSFDISEELNKFKSNM